jgi:hypothetical protein
MPSALVLDSDFAVNVAQNLQQIKDPEPDVGQNRLARRLLKYSFRGSSLGTHWTEAPVSSGQQTRREPRRQCVPRRGAPDPIPQARNLIGSDAAADGFQEAPWIDSDVGLDHHRHDLPLVACWQLQLRLGRCGNRPPAIR